jgi:diketogulonate reductase-like aldo/keto reductase
MICLFLARTQLVKETGLGKSWQMMEELQKEGKTKSIGVSNYRVGDLEEVLKVAKVYLHLMCMDLSAKQAVSIVS